MGVTYRTFMVHGMIYRVGWYWVSAWSMPIENHGAFAFGNPVTNLIMTPLFPTEHIFEYNIYLLYLIFDVVIVELVGHACNITCKYKNKSWFLFFLLQKGFYSQRNIGRDAT